MTLALLGTATVAAAQSLDEDQRAWYGTQLALQNTQGPGYVPRSDSLGEAIANWRRLQQSDNLPFNDYASFLVSHPGWPGERRMRELAERQINPDSYSPPSLVAFFERQPPLTATGALRYAEALASSGRNEEADAQARIAWRRGPLSASDESRLMGRFSRVLTQADHDARMEQLIWDQDWAGAGRVRSMTSSARSQALSAALALRQGSGASADGAGARDPAYLAARAMYLRDNGQSGSARSLLATRQPLATPPTDAEEWIEVLLVNARAAASDRQYQLAYDIASKVDDAFAPGTDVSLEPLGLRDDYTSLVWLAGTTALWNQGRAAEAIGMFDRYARAARTPQTRSKGFYWAGRAAEQAGRREEAARFYEQASAYYDYFYGMLATERLGRPLAIPSPRGSVSEASARAFDQREIVRATQMLGQLGAWQDQSLFLRTLAEGLETDEDHRLAGQFAARIGRPDLGVMVHRNARARGFDATEYGYPVMPMPSSATRDFAIAHAIMRQESQFDRQAVSHAGARGLMQLMPGTAQEVSRRVGRSYSASALTSDPMYNITLGTTYFRTVYDQWGNYVLAAASYNAGPGRARQWIAANGDPRSSGVDVVRWIEEIPIYETKNYVQRVLENAVMYDLLHPDRSTMGGVQNRLSRYLGKNTPG